MKKLLVFLSLLGPLIFSLLNTNAPCFAIARPYRDILTNRHLVVQHASAHPVCAQAPKGFARCFSLVLSSVVRTHLWDLPSGYGPADLQSAYALPSSRYGNGQTVAIIDAFDDPKAESDLAVYRHTYGLSPCTTTNGCFKKVDQNGNTSYPISHAGWSQEISLDLDMVSAICPNCHLLLVEAQDNGLLNLGIAVNTAVRLGATVISNSYGSGEFPTERSFDGFYYHPGIPITASSGDVGYATSYPAASPFVTAVGGTSLGIVDGYWNESVWNSAGSGCSLFEAKPWWQKDTGCPGRTLADVAAVSDPNTGVAVYDTFQNSGWLVFGGTSVAAPIIASIYALAGNGKSVSFGSFPYTHTDDLFDIVNGSNGSCNLSYLCTARVGYDGPTGLGTPHGIAAF